MRARGYHAPRRLPRGVAVDVEQDAEHAAEHEAVAEHDVVAAQPLVLHEPPVVDVQLVVVVAVQALHEDPLHAPHAPEHEPAELLQPVVTAWLQAALQFATAQPDAHVVEWELQPMPTEPPAAMTVPVPMSDTRMSPSSLRMKATSRVAKKDTARRPTTDRSAPAAGA